MDFISDKHIRFLVHLNKKKNIFDKTKTIELIFFVICEHNKFNNKPKFPGPVFTVLSRHTDNNESTILKRNCSPSQHVILSGLSVL